ncbi:sugar (Glycoside-Pentoside-Hexuronide) transporter [Emticicia oligotrophica DSM 17448]|uniref:Sugar (Glycoside-Pentoside-Hexuronide) transporter n=1 Tax=Emticicia oligotrophica (strain DSM 17448 / CIP 109782 / MTCC 6937 / GPTSA100-15) TaxID=929562 RepID=A0ABN4ASG4_EMTOG|nr:MFS transporter [Emticicia oligotrophica]AFK04482.1 sugar (Glycoside-Pentoside-Hexuronide) transporter [Emticicia oligotrophica DSM 17448]
MSSETQKLSVFEKIGYSLGDLAANLIFQTLMTFLAYFYTDVYKIPAGSASIIIFIGGFFGAFFNIIMGIIADRTNTRWGKFRPWVLWTSVPFGIISLLAFSTPNFDETGKIIYALITYFLLVIVYSANNLPYSALSGVITGDMKERNSLSSYRFVAVMVAQFIIQSLLLPLALSVGHGDKAVGFEKVMLFFAIVGVICLIITFLTTKERIVPVVEEKSSIKQDLLDLSKNRPWVIMLLLTIAVFITLALKGGMYIYYFKYYLDPTAQANYLESIGFNSFIKGLNETITGLGLGKFEWPEDAPTSANSLFNAGGIIFMIVGIMFSKPLADRFGKRNIFGIFLALSAFCLILFNFYAKDAIGIVFLTQILHGFTYGVTIPLLWAMIADVADYSEWKNNRRATAIIFSAMVFGLKIGLSLGGAIGAALLSNYGYVAEQAQQTEEAVSGIKLSVSIYPGLVFLVGAALLFGYEINKALETKIEAELKQRRK